MNNVVTTNAPSFFIGCSTFFQATRTPIKSRMGSKFGQIRPWPVELAALECLSVWTYNGKNVVTTRVPSILDGSSSFLPLTRKTIKLE